VLGGNVNPSALTTVVAAKNKQPARLSKRMTILLHQYWAGV
jgi:hypothetical protein